LLYFYKVKANEEYKSLSKDVMTEYREGVADPSREVGRIEKNRKGVKDYLRNLMIKTKK
jgi:hypothetical protein